MPTIYGHKLRWTEDQTDCTECGAPHDGKWFMVSVTPVEKLLCRDCLPEWKAAEKSLEDDEALVDTLLARLLVVLGGVRSPSPAPEAVDLHAEE